jgi:hypothetical protein
MHQLPPSLDARIEALERGEEYHPDHDLLPQTYLGRGRGALFALSVAGLALFFAPWVVMTKPEEFTFSGFDLARWNVGWLWGGAVGWFVMIPLVLTRRTRRKMRGARVIGVTLSCLTLIETVVLRLFPPAGHRYLPVEIGFAWGLYASALVSAMGIFFAARWGGSQGDPATKLFIEGSKHPADLEHQ